MTEDYREPGQMVNIPGMKGKFIRQPDSIRYRQGEKGKTNLICPCCGGMGIPLKGWYSCEDPGNECGAVALIETGEVFLPMLGEDKTQQRRTVWPQELAELVPGGNNDGTGDESE